MGTQKRFRDSGQIAQNVPFLIRQRARLGVDDAERAKPGKHIGMPVMMRSQRDPGVKTDMRLAHHERVAREARVGAGVLYHQQIVLMDGMRAKGLIARRFPHLAQTLRRFEPLPILIHQRHQGDRAVEQPPRQRGQRVKIPLRRRIEDVEARQLAQAGVLQRLMHAP